MPGGSRHSNPPLPLLIVQAREALTMNQEGLAARVGSSTRTVQRWEVGRATPAPWHVQAMADAVRAIEPTLAAQLDAFAPRVPAKTVDPVPAPAPAPAPAGLPAPPPPPAPAAPARRVLVDAVVCAAAEAMGVAPQAVRPALFAAFARAREAGLDVGVIAAVLAPRAPVPKATAKRKRANRRG